MEKRKINKTQIKLIHIAINKLGMSDDKYRLLLNQKCWVNTCLELSYDEASDLINHFKSLGFKIITKRYGGKKKPANIIALVSRQQLAMIDHLREDICWYATNGFNRWLSKFLKRCMMPDTRSMIKTSKEANAVIEALKAMRNRQQRRMTNDPMTSDSLRRDGGMHGGRWCW